MPVRFGLVKDDWQWEFFYKHDENSSKLYIIFSGSKQPPIVPLFKRNSWNYFFDGSVLYIADPMFIKYPDLDLGWYIGTKDYCLINALEDIIYKIKDLTKKQQIICYGSSGGGYACLKFSEFIPSHCIAINPQINLLDYPYFDNFKKITMIEADDRFIERLRVIFKDNSHYLLLFNEKDSHDLLKHLFPLLRFFNQYPKYGLTRLTSNLYIFIYHAYGDHNAQEDLNILQFIIYLADLLFKKDLTQQEFAKADALAIALSNLWAEKAWLQYKAVNHG